MPRTFARRVRLSKLSASMLIPFLAEIGTSVVLSTISRGHADGRMGQKQTSNSECSFSALPPKADVHRRRGYVRFVPQADLAQAMGARRLIDANTLLCKPPPDNSVSIALRFGKSFPILGR
jgi:hypothetical protein